MKKYLYFAMMIAGLFVMASCVKDEAGGTATEAVAGQWYVNIDVVDEDGNLIDEEDYADYFGIGRQLMLSYNTAANRSSEMFIDMTGIESNIAPFFMIKCVVPCSVDGLTFGSDQEIENMFIYDVSAAETDTTIIPADTIEVDDMYFSCLEDTSIVEYDSTFVVFDTVYAKIDTTFCRIDTVIIEGDTIIEKLFIDTLISAKVIEDIIKDSIAYVKAHTEIIDADTIVEAIAPIVDKVKIWNGKITPGAFTTPSGMPADKFEFEFITDGDDIGYYFNADGSVDPLQYRIGESFREWDGGYHHYKVTGYRYTGFADDEE